MKRRCRVSRYLTAYVDGELPAGRRRRVERHLATCEACSRELDALRRLDSILASGAPPAVGPEKWSAFRTRLSVALDRVDRAAARPRRVREVRPVYGTTRRRALAAAGVCVAAAVLVLVVGPAGFFAGRGSGGAGGCAVESIETFAAGYTPMWFHSRDPEITVIWVFSDETEPGIFGQGPGAP